MRTSIGVKHIKNTNRTAYFSENNFLKAKNAIIMKRRLTKTNGIRPLASDWPNNLNAAIAIHVVGFERVYSPLKGTEYVPSSK